LSFSCELTIGFDLTASAAVQEFRIVSSTATTSSRTIKSFIGETVGVGTAAFLLSANIWITLLHRATSIGSWIEVAVVMTVGFVRDCYAGDEKGKQVVNEDALYGACSDGAVVARIRGGAGGKSIAAGTGSGFVFLFPRNTLIVFSLSVDHGALITVGQSLTKSVDFVDWRSLSASYIIVKVAPTAVLVETCNSRNNVALKGTKRAIGNGLDELAVDVGFVGSRNAGQDGNETGYFKHDG